MMRLHEPSWAKFSKLDRNGRGIQALIANKRGKGGCAGSLGNCQPRGLDSNNRDSSEGGKKKKEKKN